MRALASYIMRGQLQAITSVVGFAVLSLPLLPLSWPLSFLSTAGVALVALIQGPTESGKTVLGAFLITALMSTLFAGTPALAMAFALTLWLPAWIMGSLLNRTRSLGMALQILVLLGVGAVLLIYIVMGQPTEWWFQHLSKVVIPAMEQAGVVIESKAGLEKDLRLMASLMTGMVVMMTAWGLIAGLLIARWWQAVLYKSGAFAEEFQALRFGKLIGLLIAALIIINVAGSPELAEMALNMLVVTMGILLLQGLAIAHAMANHYKVNSAWMVLLYMLLFFTAPYMPMLVVFVGLIDNWLDLRRRFIPQG